MTLNISVIQGAKGKRLALREARILSNPSAGSQLENELNTQQQH